MQSHKNKAVNRAALKLNPLAAGLAAVLFAAAPVYAQDAKTEEQKAEEAKKKAAAEEPVVLESVKVQGFARSIERSVAAKKNSDSIVEVITAEDIGKLPDNSIADSISRLSGVASQRVAGRASAIQIRGFSEGFSTTLLNGREQVSIGDNRGVEFDQYPSELIGGVTLYKTPDAKLIGQGLSGTVDLQSLKPLSFSDSTFSLNARVEENSLGEINPGYSDRGSRLSATYITQFADRTFGLALGIARLDSPGQNERWRSWGYPGAGGGNFNLGGSQLYATSTEQIRTGLMGVLEYKPNSDFHSVLDVFFSTFEKTEVTRGMEFGLAWSGATPSGLTYNPDGTPAGGTYTGITPVLRNDLITSDDSIFSIGWNNKFRMNDDWTAVLDINGSNASRDDRFLELYAGAVTNADAPIPGNVTFTVDRNGVPRFNMSGNYTDPSVVRLTDSSGWGQSGFVKSPKIRDKQFGSRLSFKRDFLDSAFTSLEFGVNHAEREKSRASAEFFIDLITSPTTIPSNLLQPPAPLNLTGGTPVIGFDINGVFNSGVYSLRPLVNGDVLNKNWGVNESLTTLFAQMNFDTSLGESVSLRGNFGFQYQSTKQDSEGFIVSGALANPYSAGTDYNDFLPSVNLNFGFPHDQYLRFGAAKTLARPQMDQMRANAGYGCNPRPDLGDPAGTCRWDGGGGNPFLEPTRANAYDLSYEKYFADAKGYVGLAYYYKDLQSYIYNQTIAYDYSGFVNPNPLLTPVSNIGLYNAPTNGTGGSVKGLEFNSSIPLSIFSEALDGFGFIFNATKIDSSVNAFVGQGFADDAFPGLSDFTWNATLYFEKNGFSARASHRYRDEFLGSVRAFGADNEARYIQEEGITDLQFGYAFQEGSKWNGLSFLLQVNNLNNERYAQDRIYDGVQIIEQYGEYGRQVLFGVNYKF